VSTKLTEKERRFCEAFMGAAAGNATKAARLAGYSSRSSDSLRRTASDLLTKPHIRAAIDDRIASDPAVAERTRLQRLWTAVAMGDREFESRALGRFEMRDRLRASELLAKSQGLFVDRHEVAHTVQPVTITHVHLPRNPGTPIPPTSEPRNRPAPVPSSDTAQRRR
jgi:hypothetical protein